MWKANAMMVQKYFRERQSKRSREDGKRHDISKAKTSRDKTGSLELKVKTMISLKTDLQRQSNYNAE